MGLKLPIYYKIRYNYNIVKFISYISLKESAVTPPFLSLYHMYPPLTSSNISKTNSPAFSLYQAILVYMFQNLNSHLSLLSDFPSFYRSYFFRKELTTTPFEKANGKHGHKISAYSKICLLFFMESKVIIAISSSNSHKKLNLFYEKFYFLCFCMMINLLSLCSNHVLF